MVIHHVKDARTRGLNVSSARVRRNQERRGEENNYHRIFEYRHEKNRNPMAQSLPSQYPGLLASTVQYPQWYAPSSTEVPNSNERQAGPGSTSNMISPRIENIHLCHLNAHDPLDCPLVRKSS